eukprot:6409093-Karenia_brevis.AAC.1
MCIRDRRCGIRKRRLACYDRNLVGSPSHDAQFLQLLGSIGCVPFAFDTSSHLHLLLHALRSAASIAYPKGTASKKKYYIDQATVELSHQKGVMMRSARAAGRNLKNARLVFAFKLWQAAVH